MDIFPKEFTLKEFLVFLVAMVIHTAVFSILDYGYGMRFEGFFLFSLKMAVLLFVFYPITRFVYVHFNLGRFLK